MVYYLYEYPNKKNGITSQLIIDSKYTLIDEFNSLKEAREALKGLKKGEYYDKSAQSQQWD